MCEIICEKLAEVWLLPITTEKSELHGWWQVWHLSIMTMASEPHGWGQIITMGTWGVATRITYGCVCERDPWLCAITPSLSPGKSAAVSVIMIWYTVHRSPTFATLTFYSFQLAINYPHLCAFNFTFQPGRQQRVHLMDCTITCLWTSSCLS